METPPAPDYEYRGLMAQAWDVLRGDTSGWADRPFYLEIIEKYGQPVLDVGCGTGRLLLDYLAQGIDIDGVDNSPDMLELCRQKAAAAGLSPNLYLQEMERLILPRQYRTILVPSSSFQLLIEPAAALAAARRLFDHLEPGGILAASWMTLWNPGDPLESTSEQTAQRADGAVFRRVAWSSYDPETELESTRDDYQMIVSGQVVAEEHFQRVPATRSYTQEQVRSLLESAGFSEVGLTSEFTFEAARPEDTLFCALARRAPLQAEGML